MSDSNIISFSYSIIESRIHSLRGLRVMLDRGLAYFYQVKSIRTTGASEAKCGAIPDKVLRSAVLGLIFI